MIVWRPFLILLNRCEFIPDLMLRNFVAQDIARQCEEEKKVSGT